MVDCFSVREKPGATDNKKNSQRRPAPHTDTEVAAAAIILFAKHKVVSQRVKKRYLGRGVVRSAAGGMQKVFHVVVPERGVEQSRQGESRQLHVAPCIQQNIFRLYGGGNGECSGRSGSE